MKQEQAIEEAINAMRKKPGPQRVVDMVEEIGAARRAKQSRHSSRSNFLQVEALPK